MEVAGSVTGTTNFCTRTDDSHCNSIHSSLTTDHSFDNGYVGKQPVAYKEYFMELEKLEILGKDGLVIIILMRHLNSIAVTHRYKLKNVEKNSINNMPLKVPRAAN